MFNCICLFGETFLVFFYLALEGIYCSVDGFFECLAAAFGYEVVTWNVDAYGGYLVAVFVVLVEFENDFGTCLTFYEAVKFSHFGFDEVDEFLVGVEFNSLDVYVHNILLVVFGTLPCRYG